MAGFGKLLVQPAIIILTSTPSASVKLPTNIADSGSILQIKLLMEQGRQGALTIPQRPGIVLDPITPYDSVPFGSFGLGPLQQNRVGTAALAMDVFRRARRS